MPPKLRLRADHRSGSIGSSTLQALALASFRAEEQERRRIAEGLHDAVGQALATASLRLEALRRVEADPAKCWSLNEIRALLDSAIREIGSLTFELSCPTLYTLGLGPALEGLAERMTGCSDIRFQMEAQGRVEPLAEELKVLFYRVARELLLNVVKHARARNCRLSLKRAGSRIRLVIEDDGVGFDPSQARLEPTPNGGFGLFVLRQRLHELSGRLTIRRRPSGGTRVVVEAPPEAELGQPELPARAAP